MRSIPGRSLIRLAAGAIGLSLLVPGAAGSRKDHPYRYSVVDVPVSLARWTVETPEFSAAAQGYWIMIQVEKPLPLRQMQCMMGVASGPLELKDCSSNDPLLRADWTVMEGGRTVRSGSSSTTGAAQYTEKHIFKFLGNFLAEAGKKYVVKVKFTTDGTPLNVANPHLIITKVGDE